MSKFKKLASMVLLAIVMTVSLVACNDSDSDAATPTPDPDTETPAAKSVSFTGVKAPETDTEKRSILASDTVTIDGQEYSIGYHTILRSGDKPSSDSEVFGQLYDEDGDKVLNPSDASDYVSSDNDFSSLLTGLDGNLYMISHFESVPAAMYITKLKQDASGVLSAEKTRHIDFSGVKGGWVHCAGSVTPWGTHLGSEEYEPDAKIVDATTGKFNDTYGNRMALYFGLATNLTTAGAYSTMNIYNYGWQTELAVQNFNAVTVTKHYSMGRVAHELGYVMPDKKTAYISDDGTNVGLFRFVADAAGDLSSGTLYVAKWAQTDAANGGSANITWISLGSASDAEIKAMLDSHVTYADIFDEVDISGGAACPSTHNEINTTYGHQCLQVKTGMEKAASRLETRRYAAMLGGTTEFRKMEGITLNSETRTMYLALSEIGNGMLDNNATNDAGGPNDIKVAKNTCGAVYALDLDTNYAATKMYPVVVGTPVTTDYGAADDSKKYASDGAFANNKCSLDGVANPDNLTFMPGYKTLIIGEDSGAGHENDMIWSYNVETKTLTRIQTTPYGSETTSPYFYPNYHGFGYLMSVIQHPYGEATTGMPAANSTADKRAYTGFIGPFPAMN
ncbi:PhoX family phosphatase [Seleniivibrio woodruffii]|uniref:PhoX family protein n=1 Tax=Seleniivibrio woodruffii TaxID=1078050 RepID=UPI0026EF1FBD|nr:alkaline phosphatase PhoX [Seleniivibrio woodruffii]